MRPHRHALAIGILTAVIGTAVHADTSDVQARLVEQGQYWQGRANAQRAAEAWEKVLRLDPNQVDALYGMGFAASNRTSPSKQGNTWRVCRPCRPDRGWRRSWNRILP